MKKKFILLVFGIFLLTGCDGTYELEIVDNTVIEKATPWLLSSEVTTEPYEYIREESLKYDDNGDFLKHDTKKTLKKDDKTGVELLNHYKSIKDFGEQSNIINYCYVAQNVASTPKEYTVIKTSNEFTCMEDIKDLENVTISIKSNHKLKETNADKVKGHTYYWYINRENYQNKPISLVLYSNKYVWNYNNKGLGTIGLLILTIGGTVLVISSIYRIYQRKEKQD